MNVSLRNVYIYTISELLGVSSSKIFQTFCTWYFLQSLGKEELLADLLFIFWMINSFFLLISGFILDTFNKKRVIVTVCSINLLTSLLFLLLWHFVKIESTLIFTITLIGILYSIVTSFFMPMAVSILPEITNKNEHLEKGIKFKSSSFLLSLILGPVLGGYLISEIGPSSVAITSIILSASSLFFSMLVKLQKKPIHQEIIMHKKHIFRGIVLMFKVKEERIIGLTSVCINMLFIPFIFLIVPVKVVDLGYTILEISILEIFIGFGMLLSPLCFINITEKYTSKYFTTLLGIFLMLISILSFSLVYSLHILYLLSIVIGCGICTFNIILSSRRATSIPDDSRGCMESSLIFISTLSAPISIYGHKVLLINFDVNTVIAYSSCLGIPVLLIMIFSLKIKHLLNSEEKRYYMVRYPSLFK